MQFYLGTPEPSWLWRAVRLPLFVSHRRLARLRTLRRATTPWALDSGGFSELALYGGWQTSPDEYLAAVARYEREIGGLEWAAPQDWMCEDVMLAKTGLTRGEHQRRTVASVLELRGRWSEFSDATCPIVPVLQPDYLDCIELYRAAGIDLANEPLVGVGSVCRRENTEEIGAVLAEIAAAVPGIALHGFGVKSGGLRRYGEVLVSADSQAWSSAARNDASRGRDVRTPYCRHKGACAWCRHAALAWRSRVRAACGLAPDAARFPEDDELYAAVAS